MSLVVISSVVAPRIELGTTQLSAASGLPALDYRGFSFRLLLLELRLPLANCAPLWQWFGRRSNPHLLGFNQSLYRLSYRTSFLFELPLFTPPLTLRLLFEQ